MSAPYENAIESVSGLFSELIDDGDLRAKLDLELDKLRFELDKVLLSTKTNPYIDGFVKLLIATRDIIIPMLRPLGAAYMSYIGIDMASGQLMEGVEVSGFAMGLTGTFPAWGTSRHIEKTKRGAKITDEDFD